MKWYNSGDESSTAAALRKQVRLLDVWKSGTKGKIHSPYSICFQYVHYLPQDMFSDETTHSFNLHWRTYRLDQLDPFVMSYFTTYFH
jgi:hypothetical protein